ncbi:TetR/AcrR family transcriptional regulator [Novosphingobium aquimarinum]|uniref:TetR/AcrR family transcriptional regulator n=1 Tax=Novosphingobium aquimarinum TaxID=2682494 RepID=UPI0018DCA208|nr:TetR/AcrR family transcriptional regulator [Novosphingobium aquimarinum]
MEKGTDYIAKPVRENRGRVAVRLPDDGKVESPKRSKSKKGRRGDDVRERVLKAALQCFGAFGFEGTSTRAVAERADVTHTLVLYHFKSKDLLWRATMENSIGNYAEAVIDDDITERPTEHAAAELRRFIERFVRFSAENPQVHRILTMESNQGTDRLQWVIDNFLREHFTRVRDLIRRGQMEGSVREGDPARLYYHIIGAGGTPFTVSMEYLEFTGRDIFSETEILRTIAFIYEIVFI